MWGERGMTGSHDPAHCICLPWACDWRHRPGKMAALITVEACCVLDHCVLDQAC